ncbi:MAG TPA: hypothetical protein VE954_16730 [Oligoflexus sp.]|uniref:hypothetical protein n=1 Tax=Oligoflexus sp. TaxID=1971216 RepID=UPI002D455956|nr:hypothetical protein [Oligoflexus sp.]HYX34745.1 hypothetical protein [Oligoflexus sp.]
MTARVLEHALVTSASGDLKSHCKSCERRHLCQRIALAVEDLHQQKMHVWDIEYRIRFKALLRELASLGFDFPDGWHRCSISEMDRPEIKAILRKAQELLLEVTATPY